MRVVDGAHWMDEKGGHVSSDVCQKVFIIGLLIEDLQFESIAIHRIQARQFTVLLREYCLG